MKLYTTLFNLTLLVSVLYAKNMTVDEYVAYMTEYITNASSYSLPIDNSELTNTSDSTVNYLGPFDFIVIGGGSGGSLMANRLSEVSKWNVLLLEAGGNEDDFSNIPAMNYYLRSTPMNWGYFTTPQENSCQGMADKKCVYPTGKVLGGSGVLGDMVYARGNKEDFDNWASEGNPGWSYEEILPYFKKSEKNLLTSSDAGYHGTSGELTVDNTRPLPLNHSSIVEGNIELGLKENDINGKQQAGVTKMPWTINFNKRLTGGSAFILPITKTRKNLKVNLNAFVTKILFKEKQAVGVEFVKGGKLYNALASKEVILSAGAINSAQLLMISGIGPKDELTALNISVINDLPVGKYLKDHPVYLPLYIRTNYSEETRTLKEQVQLFLQGESPLTSVFSAGPVVFVNTTNISSEVPNTEIIFINPPQCVPANTSMFYNLDADHQALFSEFNTMTDHLVYVINLVPKSVGNVTLKSKDSLYFPEINPAYYTDANNEDIEVMYQGIQYVLNLTQTEAMRAINASVVGVAPKCKNLTANSREYWMCALKYLTSTLYHPACTTRMGNSTETSVVDSSLKVHNTKGLRVVDGGSMPELVSGHPFAAIFMMAEKAADLIKAEYNSEE